MLKQLQIRNIAIIETLSIGFEQGLTAITGESGSGKSILLDAISLSFGTKASPREILRAGSSRGQVELLFDIGDMRGHEAFREFLEGQGVSLLPHRLQTGPGPGEPLPDQRNSGCAGSAGSAASLGD